MPITAVEWPLGMRNEKEKTWRGDEKTDAVSWISEDTVSKSL